MRNYFSDGWVTIKKALFDDKVNFYLFAGTIAVVVTDALIWRGILTKRDLFIYEHLGIYPLRYLMIVLLINTTLALFSYDKEKEISYLLLSASVVVSLLVFVLEIFYLSHS
ncbi:MAG: hypothetical protein M1324_04485 [Patescibacteria group bacterium]|nr:hypothetical protein [Patescibacteria group bacterium]